MTKIIFQKTCANDIPQIISIENDVENSRFIIPNSIQEHLELIKDENIEHLLIKSDSDKTIGFIILSGLRNSHKSIELRRIVICEKGRGFGREALQEVKYHCFEELGCHRLWLDVLEENTRARSLYRTEGFIEEGILRESVIIGQDFRNLVVMSILQSEYMRFANK